MAAIAFVPPNSNDDDDDDDDDDDKLIKTPVLQARKSKMERPGISCHVCMNEPNLGVFLIYRDIDSSHTLS